MAVTLDTFTQFALDSVILILTIVLSGGFVIGIFFYTRWLYRYKQFKCVVWERDGFGQLKETKDKAGIFVDPKTKNKRLFLKKAKVGLNPDTIPYLQSGKNKTIYFLRTGLKNFHYINVDIKEPAVTLTVGEEDVNWAINSYDRQKKLFQQSLFMQLMPFVIIAFVSIIILIIFIYFFKNFDVLKEMAIAMKESAEIMAGVRTGTVVLPT